MALKAAAIVLVDTAIFLAAGVVLSTVVVRYFM